MISLNNMALLVSETIVEFLDYGSRRTCRLVSRWLKEHVDDIGLSVKIDSRSAYSTALSKDVVVTEVRLLHLESYNLEPDEVRNWKTAIISTPMDFSGPNDHIFRHCSNLRVLILNESAITAEKFSGTSDPSPCFDRLSELHITLTARGFFQAIKKLNGGSLHADMVPDVIPNLFNRVTTRVQKNLRFLFNIIRSRVLKVVQISVYMGKLNEEEDAWEHQPLFEFLQKHRNSLETIIFPRLELSEPSTALQPILMNPIQLKGIRLSTAGISSDQVNGQT